MDDKRLKILLISPFEGTVGGISKWTGHILRYYNNLTCRDVILDHYYGNVKSFSHEGISLFKRLMLGLHAYVPMYFGVKERLKKGHYDVVHLCSSASWALIRDFFFLRMARRTNTRTVIHFRFGRIPELFKKRNWEYRLLIKVLNLADRIIVLDNSSLETLMSNGYKNSCIIPNPVSERLIDIVSVLGKIKRKERVVLFVGHVYESKGIIELLTACRDIPNIELRVAGYISEEMKARLLNDYGHPKWLSLLGELSYQDTVKEMLSASVFALPTYTEGFPNVVLEAMYCRCPIITTPVGAIPEMLQIYSGRSCGICVPVKSVEPLRKSISRVLDDEQFGVEMAERAYNRVNSEYSIDRVWAELTEIWNGVANRC